MARARGTLRLLAAAALTLAACGGDTVESAETGTTTSTTATSSTVPAGPRPPLVEFVPMAFDDQSGVVVALFDDDEPGTQTWLFDVAASTWRRASDAPFSSIWTRVAYHPATDATYAVTEPGEAFAFDVEADAWTPRARLPSVSPEVVTVDERTGRLVLLAVHPDDGLQLWSYDPTADTWAQVPQRGDVPFEPVPLLLVDAPVIGELVALTAGGVIEPPGGWATRTLTADGTWTEVDTETPDLFFVFADLSAGTEAVYAPAVDRVVVFTDGVLAEYDPVTRRWTHAFAAPLTPDDVAVGELARLSPTLVYDSVHDRVLVYGGHARLDTGWAILDDLWAYDPATGEWTVVLEATRQTLAE